jgi:hypothetical protein
VITGEGEILVPLPLPTNLTRVSQGVRSSHRMRSVGGQPNARVGENQPHLPYTPSQAQRNELQGSSQHSGRARWPLGFGCLPVLAAAFNWCACWATPTSIPPLRTISNRSANVLQCIDPEALRHAHAFFWLTIECRRGGQFGGSLFGQRFQVVVSQSNSFTLEPSDLSSDHASSLGARLNRCLVTFQTMEPSLDEPTEQTHARTNCLR